MNDVVCRHIEPNLNYNGVRITQALTGLQKVEVYTLNHKNKYRTVMVDSYVGREHISVTVKLVDGEIELSLKKRTYFLFNRTVRVSSVDKLKHKSKDAKWDNFSGFVEEAIRVLNSRLEVE